ncbi:MAG: DUF1549 and DUF1553 domain-containing protein [Gemmataceae bacterium]|nr:DUF1549 and DUF1553 domain-containing protein [Gemmataceae bacterium]
MPSLPGRFWASLALVCAAPCSVHSQDAGPHFVRDVLPVLTKSGCNAGACHGSFQGRGGFRLSLLGFDPQFDHAALVAEARGRRIFPAAPEHSLILRKPAGLMAHGGGRRLPADSDGYRRLQDWIARGAPGPRGADPRLTRLEITPRDVELQPGKALALKVQAHWSDNVTEDVTAWAVYDSTQEHVAAVSPRGDIEAKGPGRSAVMVRYLGQFAVVNVSVPYGTVAGPPGPRHNFIDGHLQATWAKLGLSPAPLAGDAEFVRRVHLDLIGTLPTPDEIRAFNRSNDPDKRAKLIDHLLDRSEYVDYWALKWGDLLRAHRRALGEKGLASFSAWLKSSLRGNKGMDQFVRELLLAQGNLYAHGPVAFYFVDQTPEDLAETTAQIFLGVRMQCAKCHHHPFEAWSQEDYYGLAAFFARIERKDTKEEGRYGGAQSIRLGARGEVRHPGTGQVVAPRWLGQSLGQSGEKIPDTPDPRQPLADWLTSGSNPYFARNLVNRTWGYLLGRGLVEPIDDLRATNPSAHPELLEALTKDFVAHGFDMKHLLRTICNSRAYKLASELAPTRDADGLFFTHRRPRRLPAEVLLDAVNQAAGVQEKFDKLPPETRAISLADSSISSYFLDTFGKPKRTTTCECERGDGSDLSQVLHLVNSDKLQQKLADPNGRLARLVNAKTSDADMIEDLYLATLSRTPTAQEQETVRRLLAAAPSRRGGYEDLLWTLLNCAEFVFNH